MEAQYQIAITKRIPKTEEELQKIYQSQQNQFQYNNQLGNIDIQEYYEKNVLGTVLTEAEFLKVRTEILKNWDTETVL